MGGWCQLLLMVDRIDDFKYGENGFVKVMKYIIYNEFYLFGYFLDDLIMSGVIIFEIFGQVSEYFLFFIDICDIYNQIYGMELKLLCDIYVFIQCDEMWEIICMCCVQVCGVLVVQNLKFKDIVYSGDLIEVISKLVFFDVYGFKYYFVMVNVGKWLISYGIIINFCEIK